MSNGESVKSIARNPALEAALGVIRILYARGVIARITGGLRLCYYRVRFAHLITRGDLDYCISVLSQHDYQFKHYQPRSGSCIIHDGTPPILIHDTLPEMYGARNLYLTGPKYFTKAIINRATERGYVLNTKGLWLRKERIAGASERQIFNTLGMSFFHPHERRRIGKEIRRRRREKASLRRSKSGTR